MSASASSSSTSTASTIVAMDPTRKKLDISNLMSPPEPAPYDNFSEGDTIACQSKAPQPKIPAEPMPSPPVSPDTPMHDTIHTTTTTASPGPIRDTVEVAVKDPILYPSTQYPSQGASPLFPQRAAQQDHSRIIDNHLAARSQNLWVMAPSTKREDYELVLSFQSKLMYNFVKDPRGWLTRERALLRKDRDASIAAEQKRRYEPMQPRPRFANILPAKAAAKAQTQEPQEIKPSRTARQNRITKPATKPRPIRSSGGVGTPAKNSARANSTPEPPSARRTVAPNREDKDFMALPDYSPPIDTLPERPNSLKVEWKGQPIDLSQDPFRDQLHQDERQLAATLRLDCATYLTSKRRLFIRRLECARMGKEFRKTDAQQACKIDVNKASKLWTAFEKVGWLDKKWVEDIP